MSQVLNEVITEDVLRIKTPPLDPGNIPVYGYIYAIKSGKLFEVPEATAAGKAD